MKRLAVLILTAAALLASLAGASAANAAECQKTGQVCISGPETRTINGWPVYRDCWQYQDTYSCVVPNAVDHCTALTADTACGQTSSTCVETAFNGDCLRYTNGYQCTATLSPLPSDVTQLPTTYEITKDIIDQAQCKPMADDPNCTYQASAHTCIEPGGTRNINGLDVTKDCWAWSETYVCASPDDLQSTCGPLQADPKCTEKSTRCVDNLAGGQCGLREHVYKCLVKEGVDETTTTCANSVCFNGYCDQMETPADQNFARAITGMELARQAGAYYDPETGRLFKGIGSTCKNKLGGLSNCCEATGGGAGNANSILFSAVKFFVNEGIRFLGSSYVYDALYASDLISPELLSSLYGGTTGTDYTFGGGSPSFYGISYAPGASPPFAFDPTSFAIAIAIQMVTQYLQCDQDEQVLGMRKGAGLCTFVTSWCSTKVLGACIEKKQSYCCYNSKLARIFNEQGRAQLGMTYSNPKNPDCPGFTLDQISALDFAAMDFSEFFGDVIPKDFNTSLATQRVQQKVSSGAAASASGAGSSSSYFKD